MLTKEVESGESKVQRGDCFRPKFVLGTVRSGPALAGHVGARRRDVMDYRERLPCFSVVQPQLYLVIYGK